MPVTKTAKRALRGSLRKTKVNKLITKNLEVAIRMAKKSKKSADVRNAVSLIDRATKKFVLHKNKASRLKSAITKLVKGVEPKAKSSGTKKAAKNKKK